MDRSTILANYQQVQQHVARAAREGGRDPAAIKIVVVTKGHPLATLQEAIAAGLCIFGENYADEGCEKILASVGQPGLEWHMIGHIQSRKARLVSEYYQWVHSLDNLKLALRLDRFAGDLGRRLPVLLECNVSGEASKFGWPAWDESGWTNLAAEIAPITTLPNLEVRGLMTMAPFLPDPEQTRLYFQRLRRLQSFIKERFPDTSWGELSMGMSADYEIAVQEGATMVRIGTAILGSRPTCVVTFTEEG